MKYDDDIINVSSLTERFEELEDDPSEDDADEFKKLKELLDELEGNGGDEKWRGNWYPGYLIRESHFVDYCKELCADIGDIPENIPDYIVIDWKATSANLKVDYSEVEIDGNTYLYR
jgi:hypothetical protein